MSVIPTNNSGSEFEQLTSAVQDALVYFAVLDDKLINIENRYTRGVNLNTQLKEERQGLNTGPWRNNILVEEAGPALSQQAQNTNVYSFILNPPVSNLYTPRFSNVDQQQGVIQNYQSSKNYDSLFSEQKETLNKDIKVLLTQSQSALDNFNISLYRQSLQEAKSLINNSLIRDLEVYVEIINRVEEEITNSQSKIYKSENAYGPFDKNTINSFSLPLNLTLARSLAETSLIPLLKELIEYLTKLENLSNDVLLRVALQDTGIIEDPNKIGSFSTPNVVEKDPWGIRFSYTKTGSIGGFIASQQVSTPNAVGRNSSIQELQSQLEATRKDLAYNNTLSEKRDFYFQLLPAIKSNLPVSGGTDVPGAMPGVQFRIENNIVKHKIPGYSPVYQPIGIDSIKCTLVGMFTGQDGVDLSADFSSDLRKGLFAPGKSYLSVPRDTAGSFTNASAYSLDSGVSLNTNPTFDWQNNPVQNYDPASLALPSANSRKSQLGGQTRVLSYDAFRSAQDFYNEIVAGGREVEVELNLRKNQGIPGGSFGPFRDPDTGNPLFKALIKRVDLYYVRQDRCWFILDLEITNSGLIGKECINLTNIVEEAVEVTNLLEDVPEKLTVKELEKCIEEPVTIKLKGAGNTNKFIVISKKTGEHYVYIKSGSEKVLDDSRTYPASANQTIEFLARNRDKGTLGNNIVKITVPRAIRHGNKSIILGAMFYIASLGTPIKTRKTGDYSSNIIEANVNHGRRIRGKDWLYDKNLGKFVLVDKSRNITQDRQDTLKEIVEKDAIDFNVLGSHEGMVRFILNEYLPLLTFPESRCSKKLQSKEQQRQQQKDNEPKTVNPKANTTLEEAYSYSSSNGILNIELKDLKPSKVLNNDNKEEELEEIKASIDAGGLNPLIQQGLDEYFRVIAANRGDKATVLTPEFYEALFNQKLHREFYTEKVVSVSIDPDSVELLNKKSNTNEIFIKLRAISNGVYSIYTNNREQIYREGIGYTTTVSFKAYTNSEGTKQLLMNTALVGSAINRNSLTFDKKIPDQAGTNAQPSASPHARYLP